MNIANEIIIRTHGGLAVFEHYLGEQCLRRMFHNPFRKDSTPSCHLYKNKGSNGNIQYYLQDFGDSSFCGNCFAIVAKIAGFNLNTDFRKILELIDHDLCLGLFNNSTNNSFKVTPKIYHYEEEVEKPSVISFDAKFQGYSSVERFFWGKYGIKDDILKRYNVKSIGRIVFTRQNGETFEYVSSDKYPMFAYSFNNGEGLKIYRPTAKNRFLYAGRLPKPYIFGWEQLPKNGEVVIITGGEKDVLSLAAHGFNAIAFNSETAKIPEAIMTELQGRFAKILFLYDMDEIGKKESQNRVEEYKDKYNVGRVELPLTGTKKEKDISDFFAQGRSTEELKQYLVK